MVKHERNTGWAYIIGSRKWHYFDCDGRSLCGRWFKWTDKGLEKGNDNSPDNCATCKKRLKLMQEGKTQRKKKHDRTILDADDSKDRKEKRKGNK